ncbi:MAG: penicillin-binding transpeptidase domain-containing protein, partial [Alphaproteobacteria bacterium]|nr:penicillin-binding transpeptidase domain-containing protein [Alphaproteobacteria bacterium]
KAPSTYDGRKNKERALERRNWVLRRMFEDGYITQSEFKQAKAEDLNFSKPKDIQSINYFAEDVRRKLVEDYGEHNVYGQGLSVFTTQHPKLQALAESVLRENLLKLDRRRGFRGPIMHIDLEDQPVIDNQKLWAESPIRQDLMQLAQHCAYKGWAIGIVLSKEAPYVVGIADGRYMNLDLGQPFGDGVQPVSVTLEQGDIVYVQPISENQVQLQQLPELTGGIVIMQPDTGAVLAVAGGFDAGHTQFNGATQANRQPGSCFKPFVYLAALEKGYHGNSLIDDKPVYIYLGPGLGYYSPKNICKSSYGPTPLRVGIEKSRNQMTVHLAEKIGMKAVGQMGVRFGLYER